MGEAGTTVKALADHPAIAHDHRAHSRVRAGAAQGFCRQI